ncbi:hypothetical protein ACFE04_016242 [Oxalis oulophora]
MTPAGSLSNATTPGGFNVKQGAENMIQSLTSSHSRDKKLLAAEAQQMLADSKAKIEFLKMRIMKAKQSKQQMASANGDVSNNNNNKEFQTFTADQPAKLESTRSLKSGRSSCKTVVEVVSFFWGPRAHIVEHREKYFCHSYAAFTCLLCVVSSFANYVVNVFVRKVTAASPAPLTTFETIIMRDNNCKLWDACIVTKEGRQNLRRGFGSHAAGTSRTSTVNSCVHTSPLLRVEPNKLRLKVKSSSL